ncbi:MAG: MerR family transcriptional regulator [Thermoanaerobacteraceae bacterium]|nr:MerR family transcriptional regulator [Thermoanaerobacteraceae bacterium]
MISFGELKLYKIGEIAKLAGVSRRTIDYYTNLGLLKPVRSETNYRYYSQETLYRLKIIEDMKRQRFTLEEIKEQMDLLDDRLFAMGREREDGMPGAGFLKAQLKELENQLDQLHSMMANPDISGQGALTLRQVLIRNLALIQALLLYVNEIMPLL